MGIDVFEFTFSIESDEKIVEKLCSFKKAKYRQQFSNSDKLMKIAVFQRLKKIADEIVNTCAGLIYNNEFVFRKRPFPTYAKSASTQIQNGNFIAALAI